MLWDFLGGFGKKETVVHPSVNVMEALQSIPALNPNVTFEEDRDGRTVVCVPVQRRKGFWGRVQIRRIGSVWTRSGRSLCRKSMERGLFRN